MSRAYVIDDLLPGWRYRIAWLDHSGDRRRQNVIFRSMFVGALGGLQLSFVAPARGVFTFSARRLLEIELVRPADDDCSLLTDE